jgi:hypothetical protein
MQLSEYQWSGNPRGMHNEGAYKPIDRNRYLRTQMGWIKLVTGGEEFAEDCAWFLSNNITPVIRIYRPSPGAAGVNDSLRNQWGIYASYGVKWFEFYNEPNFANPEWPPDMADRVSVKNIDEVIRPLCENWLIFADYIMELGGYPGFFSLGETIGDNGALQWLDALLGYMRDHQRERFQTVINNGLWWGTHPYALNHWYQELPGSPATPRPMEQYNALEGGWHFEYPYDPLTQSFDPGRTVFGSPSAPGGDPNGITAMGIAFNQRLQEWFGASPLPVFGTEGGIYPLPINEVQRTDPRFPGYDRRAHAEATVAMFDWIVSSAQPWMFGIALWKEEEYYNNGLPAIQRMEEVPPLTRFGGKPRPTATPRGPGPIRGEPTFHAVILAPGLDPDWFFITARSYWNTFRPMVTTIWNFIDFIPYDRSLAATVIAPPDMVESMTAIIQQQYPNVFFDVIQTGNDAASVGDILNGRVWANRRLG